MDDEIKLTAQDLRHPELATRFRGYDKQEVDQLLSKIADQLERDGTERSRLTEKLESLKQELEKYEELEETLKNTLLRIQESADEVRKNAHKESELIIREAQVKADHLVEDRAGQIRRMESKFEVLKGEWYQFYARFKTLLSSHLEMLERMKEETDSLRPEEMPPEMIKVDNKVEDER
jgi:cell division initiation protein